jgi:hypothetical protein
MQKGQLSHTTYTKDPMKKEITNRSSGSSVLLLNGNVNSQMNSTIEWWT